ncbi:unnamed protein product [Urochloa humidicola]
MKRAAQHDAGDDDSSDRRHIPRVIRNALDGARERPPHAGGYGSAVAVQMALAHKGYNWQRVTAMCEPFMEVVSDADATATLVWPEESGKPVLYDRAVFEEAFQLTWTEASAAGGHQN